MTDITMPKLSDSMEEGTILSWLVADGEDVAPGADLVEIETDKATVTHPAEAGGVLSIVAAEGTSLPVGAVIARVGTRRDAAAEPAAPEAPAPPRAEQPAPSAARNGHEQGNGLVPASAAVKATPLARRVAAHHGVALDAIAGTGPLGRITRSDVLRSAGLDEAPAPSAAAPPPAVAPPPAPSSRAAASSAGDAGGGAKGAVEVVEPTRLQAVVARRTAEAKATIPHFQVQTEVAMDAAVALRAQLKGTGVDVVPSLNDFVVKAAALALRAHPLANGAYREARFELYDRINVGIAVAADGALVVPTIFDADQKSLGAIAAEARRLAGRVRDGTIAPPELAGATFTVSNLGMYGMTAITPVINAPQAAILGVGALREVLARDPEGEIVDRQAMTLTLSCDHRILYGAEAAQVLSDIRDLLEQPLRLAL